MHLNLMRLFLFIGISLLLSACSVQQRIGRSAERLVLKDSSLTSAHVGISVFDTKTNRYLYNHQGEKYFVPASNTKIPTCYAAMKYLGDSLVGLRYFETDTLIYINPTGDPTLLHRDFQHQPVYRFLKESKKRIAYVRSGWESKLYGSGWTWNDYGETYMVERNELPIYGNFIEFQLKKEGGKTSLKGDIPFFRYALNELVDSVTEAITITRRRTNNIYDVTASPALFRSAQIPFLTFENQRLLEDTLKKAWLTNVHPPLGFNYKKLRSHATDSMLKPLMHRSDNFFAEQTLLMVSNEVLGVMNEAKIIDTLLKSDFSDLPQKPRWADGSGLSRYNLFTPQSFVAILNKMRTEFGMDRIKEIFATGGEGTISSYYKADSSFIYAKTGTLSGVVALSGFLYTGKGKLLLFSVLVNNHQASSTAVRKAVEKFVQGLRRNY
ncbi:MAG: D-alanyl-D-alanine carboxypeptidase [Chitinophagaceae bacterium]